jgi:hypothetical protein
MTGRVLLKIPAGDATGIENAGGVRGEMGCEVKFCVARV